MTSPTLPPPVQPTSKPQVSSSSRAESQRGLRFSGLISPQKLSATRILIIGVGAIGRPTALMLAQMGVGRLFLVDHDYVSGVNLGPQGYRPDQLDTPKVEAMAADLKALNPNTLVATSDEPFAFADSVATGLPATNFDWERLTAVISCADSMTVRRQAFEFSTQNKIPLFIDCRMAAEALHLYTSTPTTSEAYERTLYSNEEAIALPCTTRSTPYCASMAASFAVAVIAKQLREQPIPSHLILSLPALDLIVHD